MKLSIVFIILAFTLSVFAAQPSYVMDITNSKKINEKTVEFDIILTSKDQDFVLSSYQCVLALDSSLTEKDQLKFEYIPSSSELTNVPNFGIGADTLDGVRKIHFASYPGNDIISKKSVKVGRFRLTNSVAFQISSLKIQWSFNDLNRTILTGANFEEITNPSDHSDASIQLSTVTAVEEENAAPNNFELSQNYPNPFNPSTKIRYTLKEKSNIRLNIYNLLGESIAVLKNEVQSEGNYEVEWNAERLASGTYILALNAESLNGGENFSSTKKMTLLK